MKGIHLQTEYLDTPLGIDIRKPRFYWNCEGGVTQKAYRITARREKETVWDSGIVESYSMSHIPYQGKELHSRDRIVWTLSLQDETGSWGETSESWFEMGLLSPADWKAKWISGNYRVKKNTRYPADCFLKKFSLVKEIAKARLYITACGLYEAKLNGGRIGSFCLAPGCTDYRKRLQYQTYDVTAMLGKENCLEIQTADGWYRGSVGCFGLTNVYGRQTKLLCQLELFYPDGSKEMIASDDSFAWSNDGPIRFADLKDGEIYDASRMPSYSGQAQIVAETLLPTASNNVVPKEQERFLAQLITTPNGEKVLDFGQNIAGFLRFRIKGEKGTQVSLYFGEILDEQGNFTQENIHKHHKPVKEFGKLTEMLLMFGMEDKIRGQLQPTPKQEVHFLCSGGEDTYQMTFSVFGFRYVKVETEIRFQADDFTAIAVYSDLEQTGSFTCSNSDINQFYQNTVWSMKGNFLDIPTDCPTRERLGWTGDAQIFFAAGAYMMNVAPFFRKWLRDVMDAQEKSGKVSAVVPYVGLDMLYGNNGSSVGWADAMVLIPYRYWKRYNDDTILKECYDMMRRYAGFMIAHTGQKDKKAVRANPYNQYTYEKGVQLGEWLEPEEFQDKVTGGKMPLQTEVCTAYLHYTMTLMSEIAQALGKNKDALLFQEYADGAKKAYNWLYLQNGAPNTDRQAKLVRPLAFGLADGETRHLLQKRLAEAVENRAYRISTGFLSTSLVLDVLTKMGRADLAYKMLENEEAPGWLYEVKQGATTVWEDWEGSKYASRNHYSLGAVCQWLFDTVCGIRPDGENHFIIEPIPGGSLTKAQAVYRSLYGEVKSGWEKTEEGIHCTVSIPSNTTAEIVLPGGERHHVSAGEYVF